MHSRTRIESEEQVDYSRVSGPVGGLGSSAEEFDVNYFTPHSSSVKSPNLRPDKLGSVDRTQLAAFKVPETPSPLEPSLTSPTPATYYSEDSFQVVVGAPTTSQLL